MSKARQLADLGNVYDDGALSNRNLIINGAMNVSQRGDSTGVTASGYHGPDRFSLTESGRDQFQVSISQASDGPEGYSNSWKIETTTAETAIDSTEYVICQQKVEAQNLQHLKYGTSNAKQITLSFWVKSSIAATYAVYLYAPDGIRIIGSTYTINTASTWEYKTITFAGDTGGTINDDSGNGLAVSFVLAAGSDMRTTDNTSWSAYAGGKLAYGHTTGANAVMTTVNATWQITGVQLEVGDTATPFEHRSYGDELARCQRYCQLYGEDTTVAGVVFNNDRDYYFPFNFSEMRAVPSVTFSSNPTIFGNASTVVKSIAAGGVNNDNTRSIRFQSLNGSLGSQGQATWFQMNASGSYFLLEAEL